MSGRKEQLIRTLSSRAETAPLSKPMFAAWLVAVVFVQFVWGLWAVCTRYMQTRPHPVAPTLQLLVVLNIIAWPSVVALVYLPNCTMRRLQQRRQRRRQQQQTAGGAANSSSSCCTDQDDAYVFTSASSSGSIAEGQQDAELGEAFKQQQQELPQSWRQRVVGFAKAQALPSAIGFIACLYNLVNIYATKFTTSYLVQLMFMFTPLLVAISSSLLLRQPRAPGVYLTLLVAIGGSAMVISGKWLEDASADASGVAAEKTSAVNLAIGLLLSFACTLLMTAYMLALQVSRSLVTNEQVLMANRNMTLLVFLPLALGIEGTDFAWLWLLKPMDISVLLGSAIVIYTGANLLLQMCTRSVGANLVSVFISLRLVGSIVGEIVLLKDTPQHWLTWLGFACVIVTMTAFMCYQQCMGKQHLPSGGDDNAELDAESASVSAAPAACGASAAAGPLQAMAAQDVSGGSSSNTGSKPIAAAQDAAAE